MLTLLIAATLTFAPFQDIEPPTEQRIELAVDELEAAFGSKDDAKKLAAIRAHGSVDAKEVIRLLARALRNESVEVKKSALGALRWMKHSDSLAVLHKDFKRKRKSEVDKELLPFVAKAIGEHHSPTSIKLLSKNAFDDPSREAVRARVMALGNIRSKESIEALIRLMHSAKRDVVQRHMHVFRIALMVLTEADHGQSQDHWIQWWNKNKKTFKVAEKAPTLPREERAYWNSFWGYEYEEARDKRRRERGSDPEKKR